MTRPNASLAEVLKTEFMREEIQAEAERKAIERYLRFGVS